MRITPIITRPQDYLHRLLLFGPGRVNDDVGRL
jgi:hypothetical protein